MTTIVTTTATRSGTPYTPCNEPTTYLPTFEAEETTVTAYEVQAGDWLVEILPTRGCGYVQVDHLVTNVTDGPAFHGSDWDGPAVISRVRFTLTDGRRPLLPIGQSVVIRKRLS